ncbi:hypothetical protein ACSBLW_01060 [Thioclava sp. FR2]|uniref:hypothetical protein n=1 Tax=Thioclava sp. FR2 TaxID=3445780 RepID=UPI003EBA8547
MGRYRISLVEQLRGGPRTRHISSFYYSMGVVAYDWGVELAETEHLQINPQVGKCLDIWYDSERSETAMHDLGDPGANAWLLLQAWLAFALLAGFGFGLIRAVRG